LCYTGAMNKAKEKSAMVSDLSVEELKELIRDTVRETLAGVMEDPDAGLIFNPDFVREVQESYAAVQKGAKTTTLKQFAKEHGIKV
jgi:hypothetical protein